ncbi:DUF2318 domain-containing protein [Heliobacterium gestii]|uniref:DUF2318 domain-containing protein n=1 Tax=Heliomicrobium gestii TaxID=2699 RepID=A0A845LFE2_HELGE|nr:Fe-S-containing protein [Heliomicrobium gestii]MBM7865295.1 putative membrane protein [Heliomicrobium gestii]MZP41556.1 DUF2318 domain-containing protein [Heliomicrobium gestii]
MDNRQEKRQQFQSEKSSGKWYAGAVAATVVAAIAVYVFLGSAPKGTEAVHSYNIGTKVNYSGKIVSMAPIPTLEAENGKVELPLAVIKEKGLIRAEFKDGKKTVPVMAYVAPSGRVISAVSVCEPCDGTHFTIKNTQVACDTCDTRWDLETLKGMAGGCQSYPPDALTYEVSGDKLLLNAQDLSNWKPRI